MPMPSLARRIGGLVDVLLGAGTSTPTVGPVEHQNLGMDRQPLGQHHSLLVAAREAADRVGELAQLDAQILHSVDDLLVHARLVDHAKESLAELAHNARGDIALDLDVEKQPLREPILRQIADPGLDGAVAAVEVDLLAKEGDLAAVHLAQAKD